MSNTISVLIADDHPIVKAGFKSILEQDSSIKIVGEASHGEEVLQQYDSLQPNILLLDLGIPMRESDQTASTAGGLEALRLLLKENKQAKVVVVTMVDSSPIPERAMDLGAMGYVVKNSAPEELLQAIKAVSEGETYISHSLRPLFTDEARGQTGELLSRLTRRELEIFMYLANGDSPALIGEKMNLSHKTIHAHRASILKKLGLKSNTDLVKFGISSGVVSP